MFCSEAVTEKASVTSSTIAMPVQFFNERLMPDCLPLRFFERKELPTVGFLRGIELKILAVNVRL